MDDTGVTERTASVAPASPVEVASAQRSDVARIAVMIVTWNRWKDADTVLRALSRQRYPVDHLDVVVIDNASTDGTLEELRARWRPDGVVYNETNAAHEPAFAEPQTQPDGVRNAAGFASLTIVRNRSNMGGCGGFNTGLAFVEQRLGGAERWADGKSGPEFVWFVDDDIDLPDDTLEHLFATARSDTKVGLVGSRTMDLTDRDLTIETTIYFDAEKGEMCDTPPAHHRLHESHKDWAERVGGVRGPGGRGQYTGVREVDVASACSLLARWDAVRDIGFWDYRYFIYCDDADWSLRFGRAGWKVVLSLDAVVYHTPWNLKLTPARIYYAQRNAVWMCQKVLEGERLQRVTRAWMKTLLRDAVRASVHRRQFHAELIRRTADDIARGVSGKLDFNAPDNKPIAEQLRDAGALRPGARVAVLCSHPESLSWMRELRELVEAEAPDEAKGVQWIACVRNDVPGAGDAPAGGETRLVYGPRKRSRAKKQLPFLLKPARVAVVFDQTTDFPLARAAFNLHVDRRTPKLGQLERDSLSGRLALLRRWTGTARRARRYAGTVTNGRPHEKYG